MVIFGVLMSPAFYRVVSARGLGRPPRAVRRRRPRVRAERRADHRPAHPHRGAGAGDHPGRGRRRHRDRDPGRTGLPRPRRPDQAHLGRDAQRRLRQHLHRADQPAVAEPGDRPDLHRPRPARQRPARRARAQRLGAQAQAQARRGGPAPTIGREPVVVHEEAGERRRRGAAGRPRPVGRLRPARRLGEDRRPRRVPDRATRRGARPDRRVRLGQDPDGVRRPAAAAARRPDPDRRHRVRGHRPRGRVREADDQAARATRSPTSRRSRCRTSTRPSPSAAS